MNKEMFASEEKFHHAAVQNVLHKQLI